MWNRMMVGVVLGIVLAGGVIAQQRGNTTGDRPAATKSQVAEWIEHHLDLGQVGRGRSSGRIGQRV